MVERPVKKRGVRPGRTLRISSTSTAATSDPQQQAPQTWDGPEVASQALVMDLVEVYFEVVYPIFPFFHQPTIVRRVSRGEHRTNRAFFGAIMAMCAISSARVRDGAVCSGQWDPASLSEPSSETFFAASEQALPEGTTGPAELDDLRAYAVLSITAIQYGQPRTVRHYLGLYHTAVETDFLHDETHWPKDTGIVETEERRRLFWSMYTLDVYTSIIWGGVIRSREAQANVTYPKTLNDSEISNAGYGHPPSASFDSPPLTSDSDFQLRWLHGWNFTTDLYRILEHVVDHFRRRRPEHRLRTHIDGIFRQDSVPGATVLDAILGMYKALPARFKETPPASEAVGHRLNFQTANIAATIQLVRMMLFAAEDTTVEQRCCVASELLQAFADVPVMYLRAISAPLLHHLAGIGNLLGSVFEKGLPESLYQHVRTVLSSMVRLLASLEVGLYCTAGASSRIHRLIESIDEYVKSQRQLAEELPQSLAQVQCESITEPPYVDPNSPLFLLPPELLDDWSWAFDFAHADGP
ncbi:hypothetical protein LTR73_002462 [Friedmanniomyces endolithicus]|nr:hypothetical protein LTR73_002462 [Friedmanniomyces endolithicus]